ncbi:MAG TPA: hypothetical protein PK110_10360 [Niabella sp.]|jgi:hypothetical protein|nr:hypothetical protein [Niabella sp.]
MRLPRSTQDDESSSLLASNTKDKYHGITECVLAGILYIEYAGQIKSIAKKEKSFSASIGIGFSIDCLV